MQGSFYILAKSDLPVLVEPSTPEGNDYRDAGHLLHVVPVRVMAAEALQRRRAKSLMGYSSPNSAPKSLSWTSMIARARARVPPLYGLPVGGGCRELDIRLNNPAKDRPPRFVSLKEWSTSNERGADVRTVLRPGGV